MQQLVRRRDLKNAHEQAVLDKFEGYLQSESVALKILARPDPPDALVEIDGERTWIEITDAFLDEEHAISLTSGACCDIEHVPDGKRLIVEPDETFSSVLRSVIEAKYDKASLHTIATTYGPGILLVGVFTPFTTAEVVAQDEAVAVAQLASDKALKMFKAIYTYDGVGHRAFHVLYRDA